MVLHGSCRCGNIHLALSTDMEAAAFTPRACDCDFCVERGAAWMSDPAASLSLTVKNRDDLELQKQGSETADFWVCKACGTVVCVTADLNGRRFATINARAMDDRHSFQAPVPASPKLLAADEKQARWAKLWIGCVTVRDALSIG
ncbi:GFA family protein [Gimibacter soli]|uniref:CENP-V/GFA domain-containing protein n=1 Tax=Gimibacter soli TaxID=3024400 RepID=A0AAE9XVG7_9PROT|nr:hypothetical protein [Gimibacter soli]WCL55670.1 hypothetical protein PH603_07865 [Gimibacter soli]